MSHNPHPKPEAPRFHPPGPPENGWKFINAGERSMLNNNIKEMVAELNHIRTLVAEDRVVDVYGGSEIWNAISVVGGDLANLQTILFGPEGGPLD